MSDFIEKINQLIQEELESRDGGISQRHEDLVARIEFVKQDALKISEDPFLYGFSADEAKGYLRGISLISILAKI
jgi:hypothetical protein